MSNESPPFSPLRDGDPPREVLLTAGDLLCGAVDQWADHATTCDEEPCGVCDAGFNQVRLALKVWRSSRYQRTTDAYGALVNRLACVYTVDTDQIALIRLVLAAKELIGRGNFGTGKAAEEEAAETRKTGGQVT
jgi:hypothetical protein